MWLAHENVYQFTRVFWVKCIFNKNALYSKNPSELINILMCKPHLLCQILMERRFSKGPLNYFGTFKKSETISLLDKGYCFKFGR